MDVEEPGPGGRSPSVASQVQPGATRRGARGPYKKTANTASVSETIDAEGRLPGSKDGLGAFPPGSDWARMMLALKLKGGHPSFRNICLADSLLRETLSNEKRKITYRERGPPVASRGKLRLYRKCNSTLPLYFFLSY